MAWSKDYGLEARNAAQQAEQAATQAQTAAQDAIDAKETVATKWLEAVATEALRDSTYPNPQNGDTVRVTSTSTVYRYETGTGWVVTDVYDASAVDNISAQLDEKVQKGDVSVSDINKNKGLIDETYLSDTLKSQIAGTTAIGSTPPDKSITPIKTTFFKVGKNLFDKTKVFTDRSISSSTGETVNNPGYFASDFIEVLPDTIYTRSSGWTMAFYTENKNFISGVTGGANLMTFTTPANAKFIRTAGLVSNLNVYQVEKGSAPTSYEEYKNVIAKELVEEKPFSIDSVPEKSITPEKTTFFITSKNLFDKETVAVNKSISSTTGEVVNFNDYFASDYIPVLPNTTYTRSTGWTLAYYDANKLFISGVSATEKLMTFTTPLNARFIRVSDHIENINTLQVELGGISTDYDTYGKKYINSEYIPKEKTNYEKDPKFVAEFTTARLPRSLNDTNNRHLSLISKKVVQFGDTLPDTIGYLYLDQNTQKVYYSAGVFNEPKFLLNWNSSLSEGVACENYNAFITKDGDIIFMRNRTRENPIFYPVDNYENPFVIDFGTSLKPYSYETDAGIDMHPSGDYFMFGEYTEHRLTDEQNNDPRNIWKVTKPFNNPANWVVKHSFKHVYFDSPVSDRPDIEIGHIHTVIRDFYSGVWYCSTGDIDRHCRVWESINEGETWHEVAVNGQKWRAFGMIFTKDAAYWGTDAHGVNIHALYKVNRNESTGVLDFSTTTRIVNLDLVAGQPQPTYTTCYLRDPNGLLFLDRAEPRTDHLLDLTFWSFEYNELFKLGTFERIPNEVLNNRHGFGNQVATHYQPTTEDGIICGGGSVIRRNKVDILNNRIENRVGNVKIKIREV